MPNRGDTKKVGDKAYEWNGRRWVPARETVDTEKTPGSASSQGWQARRDARRSTSTRIEPKTDKPDPKPDPKPDLSPSDPPPRPGLDNGDELSRPTGGVNQDALNSFADRLSASDQPGENIQFRNGFMSNALPGMSGIGPVANGDKYGEMLESTKGTKGVGPFASADAYARSISAENPQAGASSFADQAEASSSVPVPGGISARSRAFLDYDGPGGSMGALRAAQASQGYIRQGGKNYAITGVDESGKRTFTEFSDEGNAALAKDGNMVIDHTFMDKYGANGGARTADEAQSPEVGITSDLNVETGAQSRESPVDFGVGDGSFEQLEDFEGNAEKMKTNPIDWMSTYRQK